AGGRVVEAGDEVLRGPHGGLGRSGLRRAARGRCARAPAALLHDTHRAHGRPVRVRAPGPRRAGPRRGPHGPAGGEAVAAGRRARHLRASEPWRVRVHVEPLDARRARGDAGAALGAVRLVSSPADARRRPHAASAPGRRRGARPLGALAAIELASLLPVAATYNPVTDTRLFYPRPPVV